MMFLNIISHCVTAVAIVIMYHEYLTSNSQEHQVGACDTISEPAPAGNCAKPCYNELQSARDDGTAHAHNKNGYERLYTDLVNNEENEDLRDGIMGLGAAMLPEGSSVWCNGKDHTVRMCSFKNLCYFPSVSSFVFLHSDRSIIHGVPRNRFNPALLDMSGVWDHNMMYFNYIDATVSDLANKPVKLIRTKSLMMKRFNVNNIMHVFHDDLLPLYHTLLMIDRHGGRNNTRQTSFNIQLVFLDQSPQSEYTGLFDLFTSRQPLFESDLRTENDIICFRDLHVGITKASTWYQYGFQRPQGPISDPGVTSADIKHFTDYLKMRLGVRQGINNSKEQWLVLLSRKQNRKIINEIELSVILAQELKMKVHTCSSETHSVAEIIQIISEARVVVGMHGSLLSFAMFLKPGSVLIELFPYAVNPENYTPYKTLSNIPGMGIIYKAWRNLDASRTVPHPEHPPELGGISHLPFNEQVRINSSPEVPKHLCCENPEWLYRIYQDTIVDSPTIASLVKIGLQERAVLLENSYPAHLGHMFPSEVQNIFCTNQQYKGLPNLHISWEQPWNLQFFSNVSVQYEVWIQPSGSSDYSAWILTSTAHTFTDSIQASTTYFIWVRCIVNHQKKGPFNIEQNICVT